MFLQKQNKQKLHVVKTANSEFKKQKTKQKTTLWVVQSLQNRHSNSDTFPPQKKGGGVEKKAHQCYQPSGCVLQVILCIFQCSSFICLNLIYCFLK